MSSRLLREPLVSSPGRKDGAADCDQLVQIAWEGPLFVVGMPRSGTKLLRTMLTRHPRIRIPDIETEFLQFLVAWTRRFGPPSGDASFERLYQVMRHSTYFSYRSQSTTPFQWREWMRQCGNLRGAAALFEGFVRYETGAERGSGVIWGDKSPSYLRHISLILELFPEAKVVHIVRDVRDHCLSMQKAWGKDLLRAAQRWDTTVCLAHGQAQEAPQRIHELRYEDLTASPRAEMLRLCNFLGVDCDERMLVIHSSRENLGDARGKAGIVAGNSRKYREQLSARHLRAIEGLAWNGMHCYGYVPETTVGPRRLRGVSLALRRIKDAWTLALRDVEGRGILGSLRFYHAHRRFTSGSG